MPYSDDLINVSDDIGDYTCSSSNSSNISQPSWGSQNFDKDDTCSYDWSTLLSTLNMTASMDSLNSTESVHELDGNFNVVLQGRIGQVNGDIWLFWNDLIQEQNVLKSAH